MSDTNMSGAKISCKKLVDLLLDYEMGDLEPEYTEAVEDHLTGCRSCQGFAQTYRATATLTGAAIAVELSAEDQAELEAGILQALHLGA